MLFSQIAPEVLGISLRNVRYFESVVNDVGVTSCFADFDQQ